MAAAILSATMACDDTPVNQVISVQQPFASLITAGAIKIIARRAATDYRGLLIIHASTKVWPGDMLEPKYGTGELERVRAVEIYDDNCEGFPLGVILGAVDLIDCRRMQDIDEKEARLFNDSGAWAWIVENPRWLEPVEIKGQQGVFTHFGELKLAKVKTKMAWDHSGQDLTDFLKPMDEVDEAMYWHILTVSLPTFHCCNFTQMGDCDFENDGVRHYATFWRADGRCYYLGILPKFKKQK